MTGRHAEQFCQTVKSARMELLIGERGREYPAGIHYLHLELIEACKFVVGEGQQYLRFAHPIRHSPQDHLPTLQELHLSGIAEELA